MRKRLLAGCLLPLLLVMAAACSKSDDGKGVASVDGTATPSVTQSVSRLDQLIRYTHCMREHGVPMTDPEVDGDTVRQGHADKGAAGDKLFPAEDACKQYRPPQEVGPVMDLKKELALKESRCMREHGVENFPDPGPDGTRVPSEVGADPDFMDARETCRAQTVAEFASRAPSPGATR
ncbi:hypothetical protein [Planotetraspora kaengkrachanensis]|uniref:Lipoprotein n=1 Tax=Planotetraspora kaengkrachanensis TaxID=575193 RepID=A0A8J3LVY4_9ACTN|nr:hypothetical protein [Planotetraspora kaengkrachanensis]GIG77503.1 hypothetical protein Pka01_06300 [Planotetraspora kaengkrachanensis]